MGDKVVAEKGFFGNRLKKKRKCDKLNYHLCHSNCMAAESEEITNESNACIDGCGTGFPLRRK